MTYNWFCWAHCVEGERGFCSAQRCCTICFSMADKNLTAVFFVSVGNFSGPLIDVSPQRLMKTRFSLSGLMMH